MSSSSSESGRDNRSRSINNHGNELSSMSYNFGSGSTSGITNRSSSASFGDPNIIVLSDSEEENASMVFEELFP